MAKFPADEVHVWSVQDFIDAHKSLTHLRPRKRGDTIVLESGPKGDAMSHARVRRVTSQWWVLELPDSNGRWDIVPGVRAPLRDVLGTLHTELSWILTPRE